MEHPIRLGIVGASGIALRRMLPALREVGSIQLAAVCSRSLERASAISGDHPQALAFDDYPLMLAKGDLDAVYVASPVHCHMEHAILAMQAGKSLLCEKPLARTLSEAGQIAFAADQTGVVAMEAYMMNFHPAHILLQKEIAAGKYGRIVSARARFACWYPVIADAWRQDPAFGGGGALMDLGSHLLSLFLYLLGPIKNARATCANRMFEYLVEDDAIMVCEMESGARAILECSFCLPDSTPAILEVCGTEGWAILENTIGQDGGGRSRKIIRHSQSDYDPFQKSAVQVKEKEERLSPANLYAAQLREFAAAISEKRQPGINTLSEGIEVMRWITEAYTQCGRLICL